MTPLFKQLQTTYEGFHPTLEFDHRQFCGDSWCDGERCGHPALVLEVEGKLYKTYSSMVAVGAIWQPFRVAWKGSMYVLPGSVDLLRAMWY